MGGKYFSIRIPTTTKHQQGHNSEVKCVAFDCEDKKIGSCSRDKSVWIWEENIDEETEQPSGDYDCAEVLAGHQGDVKYVAWHPTKPILASCGYDDTIKFWCEDAAGNDWPCMHTLRGHTSTVWQLSFEKGETNHPRLASCSDDLTVIIWNEADDGSWSRASAITGFHTRTIFGLDWGHFGLVTASGDNFIRVFIEEETDGEKNFVLRIEKDEAHSSDVNSVRWHPERENVLASCSDDLSIKLWKVITF